MTRAAEALNVLGLGRVLFATEEARVHSIHPSVSSAAQSQLNKGPALESMKRKKQTGGRKEGEEVEPQGTTLRLRGNGRGKK